MKKLQLRSKKRRVTDRVANKRWKRHIRRNKKKNKRRGRTTPKSSRLPIRVELPEILNINSNPESTIKCLMDFRNKVGSGKNITLDLDHVKDIDAAAALMLAAEIDVWRLRSLRNTLKSHDRSWDLNIRKKLHDMGLFDLLRIKSQSQIHHSPSDGIIFMKFESDSKVNLDGYLNLREGIERCMGHEILHRIPLCAGVAEALTNSLHHAYENEERIKKWWISASYSHQTKELIFLCYDRGQTIPKTLPNSGIIENLLAAMGWIGINDKIDSDLIHAALVTKRTATKKKHRGKGIPELKHFVDAHDSGKLSIYSRHGVVHYRKNGENKKMEKKQISNPIRGTLIEWCIILA